MNKHAHWDALHEDCQAAKPAPITSLDQARRVLDVHAEHVNCRQYAAALAWPFEPWPPAP